jgi:translation initiation factor IF-3
MGVLPFGEALRRAAEYGVDLIEISPDAVPPVAKIMEYGKYAYEESKKRKKASAGRRVSEVKNIQIKIGTGEHDLSLKARKVGEWLDEGHRVKIELYVAGRSKYMEERFLRERLERILKLIPLTYKVADPIRRGPKGLALIVEKQ